MTFFHVQKDHTLKGEKLQKYLPRLKLSSLEKAETTTHTTVAIGLKSDTTTGPFLLITHALKLKPPPLTNPPYKQILKTFLDMFKYYRPWYMILEEYMYQHCVSQKVLETDYWCTSHIHTPLNNILQSYRGEPTDQSHHWKHRDRRRKLDQYGCLIRTIK